VSYRCQLPIDPTPRLCLYPLALSRLAAPRPLLCRLHRPLLLRHNLHTYHLRSHHLPSHRSCLHPNHCPQFPHLPSPGLHPGLCRASRHPLQRLRPLSPKSPPSVPVASCRRSFHRQSRRAHQVHQALGGLGFTGGLLEFAESPLELIRSLQELPTEPAYRGRRAYQARQAYRARLVCRARRTCQA